MGSWQSHPTRSERSVLLLLEHFILLHSNLLSSFRLHFSRSLNFFFLSFSLTFFLQSATALIQCLKSSVIMTVDKNWSLTYVRFLVWFCYNCSSLTKQMWNIFSYESEVIFYFQYCSSFLLYFSFPLTSFFLKHHLHCYFFCIFSGLHNSTTKLTYSTVK